MATKTASSIGFFKNYLRKLQRRHKRVAVLRLSGIITSFGHFKKGLNLDDLEEEIEKAFDVPGLKAVALQVNSPGGSPVQSEFIYNRIRQISEEKKIPVYTFVEDIAASGGYWLACAGDEIYASKSSILGSIGVISAGFGYVDAIKKLGVERRVYKQGENKAVLDPFQKEDPKDIEILMAAQKEIHDAFKDMVRTRRKGKIKKTDEKQLFSGEFWVGGSAKKLGLVDEIGDMYSVMRDKYGKKVKFERISKPKSWLKRKLAIKGSGFGGIAEEALTHIEHRSIWARFGL